jgi:hypothetical protein
MRIDRRRLRRLVFVCCTHSGSCSRNWRDSTVCTSSCRSSSVRTYYSWRPCSAAASEEAHGLAAVRADRLLTRVAPRTALVAAAAALPRSRSLSPPPPPLPPRRGLRPRRPRRRRAAHRGPPADALLRLHTLSASGSSARMQVRAMSRK